MKKMIVETWVIIGAFLILCGTLIMWYFPYKEGKDKELEVKETGKVSRRLPLNVSAPRICFGNACFDILGEDHVPIITDGKGKGKLYIPSKTGKGEGILYSWIQDQEMKLSLSIYDEYHEAISYIDGNEWVVKKSKTIDCNFDLNSYEVIKYENDSIRVLLQIELTENNVQLGFETTLKDGTKLFLGNNKMEFTGENRKAIHNYLKPIFKYPSNKNFGKRNN
jgi:hypothetical protein